MGDRSVVAKTAVFFAVLVAINYWPVFLGRVPLPTDVINQFPPFLKYHSMSLRTPHAELGDMITEIYPWRKFASDAIRSGALPLWNPNLLAGMPFQANPLSALFHPLNLVFVFLPLPTAWSLSLMLKVLLAGIFTFLFLREIGASVSGSVVAAVAFAFGGAMTAWLAWPRGDTSVWLPLLCWRIHRLCREPCRRQATILGVVLAITIVSGHPPMIARVLATVAAYGIWIVVWQHSPAYRRQIAWLFAAGCLALGLGAVQLIPSVEWLGQIYRTLDMKGEPLPLWQAIGFFSRDASRQPNSAGVFIPEGTVYLGALSLLGAVFALLRHGKRDATFFSILFAINFCIAYGVSPFIELAQGLPVFSGIRMDEALLVACFSLAVLAGLGVSYIEAVDWKNVTKKECAAAVGILLLATATFHSGADVLSKMTGPGVEWWLSARSFRVLLVVSALLVALRLLRLLSQRQWVVLASLLIAVDLVSYSYAYIPFNRAETIYPEVPLFDFLSQRDRPFRVVALDGAVPSNTEYVYGLASAAGYEYMLKRTLSVTETLAARPANGYALGFGSRQAVESNNRILDLLNVRYLIATKYNDSESLMRANTDRFREVWSDGNVTVFENRAVLPKAFLVPQTSVEKIDSEEAQLARLRESSFDPEHSVILGKDLGPSVGNEELSGSQPLMDYSEDLNAIRMRVNATTPSVLVLSQMYYPGWKVYVDGKPAPLLRPDYAFTGTTVNAGTHDVQFRFRPMSFFVGLVVSVASLLLTAVGYAGRN